jgi:hypothetical protein
MSHEIFLMTNSQRTKARRRLRQAFSPRHFSRRQLIVCLIIALAATAGVIVYARRAARAPQDAFAAARDVPRGALVYVQCENLREMLQAWDESKFKDDYLASQNFKEFASRHLALRLLERWETANDALGFTLDMDALRGISDSRAALAMYDIGRLEMVFVAPLSAERARASEFFSAAENLETVKLPDGTKYFRRMVAGDKKKPLTIVFAALKGRFILATNEQLFLRTLANVNDQTVKDRLADEPDFSALTRNAATHFFTVWVNQQRLNDDSYFRRYWAFANTNDFRNTRAAIFDLERRKDEWIERRAFLRDTSSDDEKTSKNSLTASGSARLARYVPSDAPYFRLTKSDAAEAAARVKAALFERAAASAKRRAANWSWRRYNSSDFDLNTSNETHGKRESRYSYPGDDYESQIDDPRAARTNDEDADARASMLREADDDLSNALQQTFAAVAPQAAIFVENPQTFAPPLFAEFRRAAAFTLAAPEKFNRANFEATLMKYALRRATVSDSKISSETVWRDVETNGGRARVLQLPLINSTLCYALRNQDLLVSNSAELLGTMLANSSRAAPNANVTNSIDGNAPPDELTLIRFARRREVFDALVERLDAPRRRARAEERAKGNKTVSDDEDAPVDFFSGNVRSLLDAAAFLSEIKIAREERRGLTHEVVEFKMKSDTVSR